MAMGRKEASGAEEAVPLEAGSPSDASAQETFDNLFDAAERLKAIGRPPEEVIAMYLSASGAAATLAEACHAASRFCRENDNFADGYEYARRGLQIPAPAGGVSVQSWVYDYGLLDELAVNAYWTGRYAECADACDRLLTEVKLPPEHRERILKNREFALGKLPRSRRRSVDRGARPQTGGAAGPAGRPMRRSGRHRADGEGVERAPGQPSSTGLTCR